MDVKGFLGSVDNERIVAAIRDAESRSRGEIKVHVAHGKVDDAQEAAARLFEKLGMTATKERNGVLLFIAPKSQRFAILGDAGIHAKAGEATWNEAAAAVSSAFKEARFTDGMIDAVKRVGDVLALHFPRTGSADDRDELSNEVSESH